MSLYLCVDCGGSKTATAICDADGKIVGRGIAGPSNFAYLTLDAFIAAVSHAVTEALKACLTPSADPIVLPPATPLFAAAWFGISGVDSPAAVAAITPPLSSLLNIPAGPRLQVANDTHLLAAPLRMHHDISSCVTVIGGTGATMTSFRKLGDDIEVQGRYGGWGWILGDEGGGYSVGREVIRQLLDENDRASVRGIMPPDSKLKTSILQRFGASHIMELLAAVHFHDPSPGVESSPDMPPYASMPREKRLSSLSPLVFSAAFEDSDPLALNVLRTMAAELAIRVAILVASDDDESPRAIKASDSIVSFGGSLVGVMGYRRMVLDELERRGHVFKRVEYVDDAAGAGAVALAVGALY
ncbi:hypothetical protein F5887DRAFT_964368 [Amanita rubescens]|nr:hypothetical protein F5887DRAFT_964368 [Amanita rubescens]